MHMYKNVFFEAVTTKPFILFFLPEMGYLLVPLIMASSYEITLICNINFNSTCACLGLSFNHSLKGMIQIEP